MIEASTGSLGHGLPIAVGMAKAFKILDKKNKVICIVGDGEMQEGSNFEALALAYRFKLDNLLVIIDANSLQAMDFVKNVALDNNKLANILSNYTENFKRVDGHNEKQLFNAFSNFFNKKSFSFSIVFCDTVKGKGLEIAQNKPHYHFRCPVEDGYIYEE
jgi:transketolase